MPLTIREPMTGQEIVKNFLLAANFRESSDVRWESMDFDDETGAKGVIAYPCNRKKKYRFFGPDRWVRDFSAVIYLHPLALDEEYNEIQVEVRLATFNPSQRTIVPLADYKKWKERHVYLYRQLEMILKNAFLI